MTDPDIAPRSSGTLGDPDDALYLRIRNAVEREPASSVRLPVRLILSIILAVCSSVAVLWIASRLVYQQQGVGLQVAAPSTLQLRLVLLLLVGLGFIATLLAIWRGRHGFGVRVTSLIMLIASVTPLYAAFVLVRPVHANDPPVSVLISP